MGISSRALYLDLVEDLKDNLPYTVYTSFLFENKVEPWPDITIKQQACVSLLNSFYKKNVDEVSQNADLAALEKFLKINDLCRTFELKPEGSWDEELIGTFKQHVWKFFTSGALDCPGFSDLFNQGDLGPGANIGAKGGDFYSKLFSSRVSTTSPGLSKAYSLCVKCSPTWNVAFLNNIIKVGRHLVVKGNKLSYVPKTRDISRTICTEPTLNMFFQKGYGELICKNLLAHFNVNLSDQADINRDLCRIGSETGRYSTIDLSNASDSISLNLLRQVLPRETLGWLLLLRSPVCEVPGKGLIDLHMVSTMGNGFTFPLQTALFACVISTVYSILGIRLKRKTRGCLPNFGVFGDDIIVDAKADTLTRRLLNLLGFIVNHEKSYNTGPFRESCGRDYFRGHDVRGVYCKTLRSVQDRYSLLNRLNRWSARHSIQLWRTCQRLLSTVPRILVPRWESDDSGVHVPFFMVEKRRFDRDVRSIVYKRWVVRRSSWRVLDSEKIWTPHGKKRLSFVYEGLKLSAIKGSLRAYSVPIRLDRSSYTVRWGIAPNWDYSPMARDLLDHVGWSRWNDFSFSNLGWLE